MPDREVIQLRLVSTDTERWNRLRLWYQQPVSCLRRHPEQTELLEEFHRIDKRLVNACEKRDSRDAPGKSKLQLSGFAHFCGLHDLDPYPERMRKEMLQTNPE